MDKVVSRRNVVETFQKNSMKLESLYLVNVIVMIKIEKSNQVLFFVYFIDQDKRASDVSTAFTFSDNFVKIVYNF